MNIHHLSLPTAAAAAAVVGAAAVVVVSFVAKLTGNDLLVAPEFGSGDPEALELWMAVLATLLLGGLVGPVLAAVLALGVTPRPGLTFLALSAAGLVAYGILAFIRTDEASTTIWLNAMHVAAAIPSVGALTAVLSGQSKARATAKT